jgi:hypothetical protein
MISFFSIIFYMTHENEFRSSPTVATIFINVKKMLPLTYKIHSLYQKTLLPRLRFLPVSLEIKFDS